jgi:hypothetical protein
MKKLVMVLSTMVFGMVAGLAGVAASQSLTQLSIAVLSTPPDAFESHATAINNRGEIVRHRPSFMQRWSEGVPDRLRDITDRHMEWRHRHQQSRASSGQQHDQV